jgi:DNA-binding winged helix-turn-helix (wHTH) protein
MFRDEPSPTPEQLLSSGDRLHFAGFVLDPAAETLTGPGGLIALAPLPFRLLVHLARNAGRLVTHEELWREVWLGRHVEFDAALTTAIRKVRLALGDTNPSRRLIEAVPRRGYRFVATVRPESRTPVRSRFRLLAASFASLGIVLMGTFVLRTATGADRIAVGIEVDGSAHLRHEAVSVLEAHPDLRVAKGDRANAVLRLALNPASNMLDATITLANEATPAWRARLAVSGEGAGPDAAAGVRDLAAEASRLIPHLAGSDAEASATSSEVVVTREL